MTDPYASRLVRRLLALLGLSMLLLAASGAHAQSSGANAPPRTADFIVAVVNQELVTNAEVERRIAQIRADAARSNARLPSDAELRRQVIDVLIDERVQVTNARDSGQRVDDVELDRAVANVAAQNQMTMPQLRERLAKDGQDFKRFRDNIRDQIMMERVREKEVNARIKITDAEIDALLQKRRAEAGAALQLDIAQILITVPEGASITETAQRRVLADKALARVLGGESFDAVAREVSEDGNRAQGGDIGMRPADRLPDVFVAAVQPLKPGEVSKTLLRSAAGFHILKLVGRIDGGAFKVQQSRVRHILIRPSAQLTERAVIQRLTEFKRQIEAGSKTFEELARDNSEDGSAPQGGELGWVSPGMLVPEFEQAMNKLPLNGISDPVVTRFGVHLIQVLERREVTLDPKQEREQASNILREQKFEAAYEDWIRDLRARAYVEMREPPQ
ncbi:MAG: peptidylprolyl isomerase [Proteobacteria bacterium]|nr:peptidylprolyl isomerase [Pseudomonadota bacterium]